MRSLAKPVYYHGTRLPGGLAARYFRLLGGPRRILDVGCGLGDLGRLKPSSDFEVHGVDIDSGALKQAAQFETVVRVDLDCESLPYEKSTFDAVVARDILEHLQHPEFLAGEIHRVLRPSGVLIASVVMAKPRAVWADYTHMRGFTRSSARLLIEDAGFRVEAIWPMGGVPLSNRLNMIEIVPFLLRIPPFGRLWGSSWELLALR